jgi:hypothetical protein
MSEEPPAKRARKGTKSCQECRHRKTRCIWPSDNAKVCQGCHTRNRICELQVEVVQTSETAKLTSRARIDALEKQVSDLWQAINQNPPVFIDQQQHATQSRPITVDGMYARVQLSQAKPYQIAFRSFGLRPTLSVALQSVVTSNIVSKEISGPNRSLWTMARYWIALCGASSVITVLRCFVFHIENTANCTLTLQVNRVLVHPTLPHQ